MARVLARHASGISLKQIAAEEYMAYSKVKTVTTDARKRLGANNLVQAGLRAHQLGYLSLPDEAGVVRALSPLQSATLDNTAQEEV